MSKLGRRQEVPKSGTTSWNRDEDVAVLMSQHPEINWSKFFNESIRARFGDERIRQKAELLKRKSELTNELLVVNLELERIEADEKLNQEIFRKMQLERFAPAFYMRKALRGMANLKNTGIVETFYDATRNRRARFAEGYESILRGIDYLRKRLEDDAISHSISTDLDEIIERYSPTFRDIVLKKRTQEEMLTDPEFMRIVEVRA